LTSPAPGFSWKQPRHASCLLASNFAWAVGATASCAAPDLSRRKSILHSRLALCRCKCRPSLVVTHSLNYQVILYTTTLSCLLASSKILRSFQNNTSKSYSPMYNLAIGRREKLYNTGWITFGRKACRRHGFVSFADTSRIKISPSRVLLPIMAP
jgi:hypothetical protein